MQSTLTQPQWQGKVLEINEGGQIFYNKLRIAASDFKTSVSSNTRSAILWCSCEDSPEIVGIVFSEGGECQIAEYCLQVLQIKPHSIKLGISATNCSQSALTFQPSLSPTAYSPPAENILEEIFVKYGESVFIRGETVSLGFLQVTSEGAYLPLHLNVDGKHVFVRLGEGGKIHFEDHCLQIKKILDTEDGYPSAEIYVLPTCKDPQIIWNMP